MFKSFQSRMILFFSLLFILIQCGVLYAVYQAFQVRLTDEAKDELNYASQVFQRRLVFQDDVLKTQALLISSDYIFQEALTKNDMTELSNRLIQLRDAYRVERIILVDGSHVFTDRGKKIQSYPLTDNLKKMLSARLNEVSKVANPGQEHRIIFTKVDGVLYEFYLVGIKKVNSNDLIWFGVGASVIKDSLVELNQKFSTNLSVLFYIKQPEKKTSSIVSIVGTAQSLPQSAIMEMIQNSNKFKNADQWGISIAQLVGHHYLMMPVKQVPEMGNINKNIRILLLYPTSEIFKSLNQLMMKLLLLFSYGLVFIIVGAWLLGIKMSEPIKELVKVAREIARGRYDVILPKRRQDEFKTLSETFGYMVKTIQEREAEIRYTALHDIQTQLPNRQYFEELLDAELKRLTLGRIQNIGVMFIGIGRLDEISHTLGHGLSDLLILKVIKRLSEQLGIKILARFSDDRLILVFENQSMTEFESAANKIHGVLEAPYRIQSFKIDITPYIGLCLIQKANCDAKTWIRRGDNALYQAREQKISIVPYQSYMDRSSSDQLSIMGDLVSGIKNGEFELWFQPKMPLSGQSCHYVEALVRWHRPQRGLVKPEDFIPLAERTGHIQKLTNWALEETCIYIKQWLNYGYEMKIAVNISSYDLIDGELFTQLKRKLNKYQVPARLLALEITESDVIKNLKHAKLTLEAIAKLGVSIAIDDFGIGYSSIAYLKELPINEIKIDKSFITRLNLEPESVMIVGSIIELAHKMGLSVVAEGVESEEVITQLRRYHCDYVQGYYYSEPISLEQLLQWIDKQN